MQQQSISNKKVLLVINAATLGSEVLLHGINLSKRMDASLEILHLLKVKPTARESSILKKQLAELKSSSPIAYIQLTKHRGLTVETVDYAKNRRNIICVVLCLKGKGVPRKKGERQAKFNEVTKLLNCPVVLYQDSQTEQLHNTR